MAYGQELILDLYGCDPLTLTRESITEWLKQLCELIDMRREDLYFWEYDDPKEKADAPDHLNGTSAVQFITTSDIVIHTLDRLGECYINLFSCKDYDILEAIVFTKNWFKSANYEYQTIERGKLTKCKL